MPHCVLLLRIRCCARAAVDSDTEPQRKREQEGGCGVRVVAALQLFSRVENTDHSLTLPSLRSSSSNELPGIDCDRAFIPPLFFPRGEKSICHLQFIVCFMHVPMHE